MHTQKIMLIPDYIEELKRLTKEKQELELELSGYRQAILNDKEMLGLKEENDKLKKQLEEYKDNYNCLLEQKEQFEYIMSKQVDYLGQKKEFIKYLEDGIKSSSTLDTINKQTAMYIYSTTLRKYKDTIGDKK